ncbi:MAG: PHP domain-containing protein [Candidatus Methanomethylophilaceae archaeon]|nr:PHP domain-containing protein [Thermoplasmata archaeon]MBQ3685292.1 PHP domain-containing protein [Candidatus Methanomethylophilaceae archaeon]
MGRADTHLHTEYSGYSNLGIMKFPESVTTPAQQVDKGIKNGMDVIAITDHDETRGAFEAQKYAKTIDGIDVIAGEEITTADGEIIGLFLTEKVPAGLPVEETADIVKEQGGLLIVPHPFSFHVFALREKMFDVDFDGFETINGGHPDKYTNRFARAVMDRYPGKWAETASSDAHSLYTSGTCWTEFEGTTAEEFRKAILNRTTKACGKPASVFSQVQWSMNVAFGGQKLLYKSLRGTIEYKEDDHLVEKIESINRLKKATGMVAATAYAIPPIPFLATTLSVYYLHRGAKKLIPEIPQRLEGIDEILRSKGKLR